MVSFEHAINLLSSPSIFPRNMLLPHLPFLNSLKILLASASPRRSSLLQLLGVQFTVGVSDYPENQDWRSFSSPVEYVQSNALMKLNFAQGKFVDCDLIIAADTIVEAEGQVYEKPVDAEDAKRMMRVFSGAKHQVHTAVLVWVKTATGSLLKRCTVTTDVHFEELDESMLQAYAETREWEGKAGGYGIQLGAGAMMIRRIEGCYYNIMGFPMHAVAKLLREVALEVART